MKPPAKMTPSEDQRSAKKPGYYALERKADDILRKNGTSVLSPRDQLRKDIRRHKLLQQSLHDEGLTQMHGSDGLLEQAKRSHLGGPTDNPSGHISPHTTSTENQLLEKERQAKIQSALDRMIWEVFDDDRIVRLILLAVLRPPGAEFSDNQQLITLTGLTEKQVLSAKARMKYRAKSLGDHDLGDLIQFRKGEAQ